MSTSKGITPLDKFRREFPDVAGALDEQGWTVGMNRNSHLKFRSPTGALVMGAGTPSARNSWKRTISVLKRNGLVIEDDAQIVSGAVVIVRPGPVAFDQGPPDTFEDIMPNEETTDFSLPVEHWTSSKTAEYLQATAKEIAEWRDAGFLEEALNVPERRGRGRYFLNSVVIEFANSDPFIQLRREHRKYTRRAKTELPVVPVAPAPVEIEHLRIVVARRSMEELTPKELAAALVTEMRPEIESAVELALGAILRKMLSGLDASSVEEID